MNTFLTAYPNRKACAVDTLAIIFLAVFGIYTVLLIIRHLIKRRNARRKVVSAKRLTAPPEDLKRIDKLVNISSGNRIEYDRRSFRVLESTGIFRDYLPPTFCHVLESSDGILRWLHVVLDPVSNTYCDVILWQEEAYDRNEAAASLEPYPPYNCIFKGQEYLIYDRDTSQTVTNDGDLTREFALYKGGGGALLMFERTGNRPIIVSTGRVISADELTIYAS